MPPTRKGLGRGLDSLIPQSSESSVINPPTFGLVEIDPKAVLPNPEQPRLDFDEGEIDRLAESIKLYGLLHPIVVEQIGGSFRLVAGERRLRATQKLGLATIPAIIRPTAARRESLEIALSENLFRSDLSAIEEAAAYSRLVETFGLSHETIASRLGKSRTAVSNTIRLLALPAPIQQAIRDGRISAGHGRALLAVTNIEQQEDLTRKIIMEEWSVRATELFIQQLLDPSSPETTTADDTTSKPKAQVSADDDVFCKALESLLGAPVVLKRTRVGGHLVIRFHDNDDLSTLYNRLGGPPL